MWKQIGVLEQFVPPPSGPPPDSDPDRAPTPRQRETKDNQGRRVHVHGRVQPERLVHDAVEERHLALV